MKLRALISTLLLSFVLGTPGNALFADEIDPTCVAPEPEQDRYQYLRSLSLALKGVSPSLEELESLHTLEDVPDEQIDSMLDSPDFAKIVSRFHRALLWNRIDNRIFYNPWALTGGVDTPASGYHHSAVYRGKIIGCKNEPAEFTEDGQIIATWNSDENAFQEGYVMVEPYWAPGTELKICAFNAQEALVSAMGTPCGTPAAKSDPGCGCGPNLRWCFINGTGVPDLITQSMSKAVEKTIGAILLEDRPYTDLFLNNKTWVNGPIVHLWKYFAQRPSYLDRNQTLQPAALDINMLPDLAFTDEDTWLPVELPPYHAGVFTTPAYLLRFTVNRRRARQFYESFLCSPFLPPAGGLELDPESALEPNLQERVGCNYCHKSLEPAAAHWGRWTSRGAGYLDPLIYPAYDPNCVQCIFEGGCTFDCNRHYVMSGFTTEETEYIGWLQSYQFLKDEHMDHVEFGPKLLFQKKIVDGTIAQCTTKRAIEWLIRRDLEPYETKWIQELGAGFISSGYNYKTLIKTIVTHPYFRRVL